MAKKLLFTVFLTLLLIFQAFGKEENTDKQKNPVGKGVNVLSFEDTSKMFKILPGKWAYSDTTCENPFVIRVSSNQKSIRFTQNLTKEDKKKGVKGTKKSFTYEVLEVTKHYIRTKIKGETRKGKNGKLLKWDFIFVSKDEFRWHRTDWDGILTSAISRCVENNKKLTAD